MTGLSRDLRVALRTLARRPGFTAAVVLTLALGIGGATTMYGFLQAVARHGQPTVPEPERIARLFTTTSPGDDTRGLVSFGDYRRWREAARSFESLAAYTGQTLPLQTTEGAEDVGVLWVTPSYLSVLATPPVAGRLFSDEDARASDGGVALVSERAWRSRFGGEATTLGRSLEVDGKSYAVVGVVSERLGLVMGSSDLYLPLMNREDPASVMVIGRRRGGVSWAQVRAEMDALGVDVAQARPHVRVLPILDDARYRTRMAWLFAVGPAILVLLIGCGVRDTSAAAGAGTGLRGRGGRVLGERGYREREPRLEAVAEREPSRAGPPRHGRRRAGGVDRRGGLAGRGAPRTPEPSPRARPEVPLLAVPTVGAGERARARCDRPRRGGDATGGESGGFLYMPTAFGGLALLLAAIGVFGVMSQLVAERRVELGVRLALGASPGELVRLVVRDGLIRVVVGAGLGLVGLVASVRAGFAGLLGATLPDPWVWLGVVSVVALSAVAACYLPARRAARLDPMMVLRSE